MSNYGDYKHKTRDQTDPPGDKIGLLEIATLGVFGDYQANWFPEGSDCEKVAKTKLAQARKYLSLLFGVYKEGFVEIRSGKESPKKQTWFDLSKAGWMDKLVAYAFHEEFHGNNVFVGVLPRSTPSGYQNSVKQAAVFWADIDFKNTSLEEAKKLGIEAFDVIVKSGGGLHLYQLIEEPVSLEGVTRAKFKQRHEKLLQRIKSDPVQNFDRILRLPGTTNFKPERATNGVQPKVELVKWPGQKVVIKPEYKQGALMEVIPLDKSKAQKEEGLKEAFG